MSSEPTRTEPCPDKLRVWLTEAVRQEASDLHLVSRHSPVLRVHGVLRELDDPPLEATLLDDLLPQLCPQNALERLAAARHTDFAYQLVVDGQARRFCANYFYSGRALAACFRVIPSEIPDFEWAGFPRAVAQHLAHFRNGLVLITGVTGSGKTTTLAMIINLLNCEGGYRIITVEEPVEYILPKAPHSLVTQREVGQDVHSFAEGLRSGLRQDPDVILVGEIRDRETAQMALSAAETGHLVFATLHTRDAKGAISRYVDLFPQIAQSDVRSQLSLSLRAVISQHLLPSIDPSAKRVLALEILYNNHPVASGIRFGKIESIDTNILMGQREGMISLDESIKRLLEAGRISRDTAERFVSDIACLSR